MAKRLKQTKPSVKPSKILTDDMVVHQDPREAPSLSTRIMDGAEKAPKGSVTAAAMEVDKRYVNYEKTNRVCVMVPDAKLAENKIRKIKFWSGPDYGWLETTVPFAYPLIATDHKDAPRFDDPALHDQIAAAKAKDRTAHLPKFKKTKPDPEPCKADGKLVFKGKLGGKNVLFDAGDGSTVATLEPGANLAEGAKKAKRELVSQKDPKVTAYAMFVFTKQWNAQK